MPKADTTVVPLGTRPLTNYASYPQSVNELRGDDAVETWTPREALIKMLRDIDSGAISLDGLIMCFLQTPSDDHEESPIGFVQAGSRLGYVHEAVGVLEVVKTKVLLGV